MVLFYKLSEGELAAYLLDLQDALSSEQCPTDDVAARYNEPAQLEFPLGEITNPKISRFVLIWQSQGVIQIGRIGPRDRFDAQGLEGKCIIPTTLLLALLAARELPSYRRAVSVSPSASPKSQKRAAVYEA